MFGARDSTGRKGRCQIESGALGVAHSACDCPFRRPTGSSAARLGDTEARTCPIHIRATFGNECHHPGALEPGEIDGKESE
jgi:hypothetical protein